MNGRSSTTCDRQLSDEQFANACARFWPPSAADWVLTPMRLTAAGALYLALNRGTKITVRKQTTFSAFC